MNIIKKYLGGLFMLLSLVIIYLTIEVALKNIDKANEINKINTILQWGIILTVFIPCCLGFFIFGYFSYKGEYNNK